MRFAIFNILFLLSSIGLGSGFAVPIDKNAPEIFFASEESHDDVELGGTVTTRLSRFDKNKAREAQTFLLEWLRQNCMAGHHGGRYYIEIVRTFSVLHHDDSVEARLHLLKHGLPSERFRGSALLRSFCRHLEF